MIASPKEFLNVGVYTPKEAALYARVSTPLMNRWVFGNAQGDSVIRNELSDAEKTVSFLDFVQTLAVRSVRMHQLPLPKIRAAYERARDKYAVKFPFAVRHQIYLFGDLKVPKSCEIVICIGEDESGERQYEQLTGKKAGNKMLGPVLEPHLQDLNYDSNNLAMEYRAYHRGGLTISMNPKRRFGEPIVESCGYSARTLYEAYKTEGGVAAAARVYGIAVEEVELACNYFDYLQVPVGA